MKKYLFKIDPLQSARMYLDRIKSSWKELEECYQKMEEQYIALGVIEPDLPKWLTTGEKEADLYPNSVEWEKTFQFLNLWMDQPEKLKETPLKEIEKTLQFALTVSTRRDAIIKEYKFFLLPIYNCGL